MDFSWRNWGIDIGQTSLTPVAANLAGTSLIVRC
jgi:hypothetical protein